MKTFIMKNKVPAIIIAALLAASAVLGVILWQGWAKNLAGLTEELTEQFDFQFYQSGKAENLANSDDVGVMIMDCDAEESFRHISNGYVVDDKGKYVQGTGALVFGSLIKTAATGYFDEVNIVGYETGSIHVSLYVSDVRKLTDRLVLEITSSGGIDSEEISWSIAPSLLKDGWNELYLGIGDASKTGEINFQKVNFFRFRATGIAIGTELIMDNVYATHTKGMSLEAKGATVTASTKPGFLMDCDSLDGVTSSVALSITTADAEHKEGTGAIAVCGPTSACIEANLRETDISAYARGKIAFWLYVNDASYVKDGRFTLEITSSGTCDKEELSWKIAGSELTTGWNQVSVALSTGKASGGEIDLSKVNYLRLYVQEHDPKLIVFVDAVRVQAGSKIVPENGMILSCDTEKGYVMGGGDSYSITTSADEHKEGTGAFKSLVTKQEIMTASMSDFVDISKYADGTLHLWVYISDVSKITEEGLAVELGSAGKADTNEYQWNVAVTLLENGWNELLLDFEDAKASKDGGADLSSICWFRIFTRKNCTGKVTFIIDDVRATEKVKKPAVVTDVILNCDNTNGLAIYCEKNTFSVTTKAGEFVEGSGAFKSVGTSTIRWAVEMDTPVDISAYADGCLSFQLYISDPSKLSAGLAVELGSGGEGDKNEYQWVIDKENLVAGWNTCSLAFANAKSSFGAVDMKNINWLRIHRSSTEDIEFRLDDVRATERKSIVTDILLTCDTTSGLSVKSENEHIITTVAEEHKEGVGAYKNVGAKATRWSVVFDTAVDITQYEKGGIHLWLYISDPSKLSSTLKVGLGSAGTWDQDEYIWSIEKTSLQAGWNELNLKFTSASEKGTVDLSAINWFRVFRDSSESITMILDDVRAVEKVDKMVVVTDVIMTCDSVNGLSVKGENEQSITTADGEYKEGTGAFKSVGTGMTRWAVASDTAVDITEYQDGGLHFWLYISDPTKLNGVLKVGLGSAGTFDKDEYIWSIEKEGLQAGWNEFTLKFASAKETGTVNLGAIDWFRIFRNSGESITMILDDVRAVENTPGMILDCESEDGFKKINSEQNVRSIVYAATEHKQGLGAFQSVGSSATRWAIVLNTAVDVSAYEGGGIHLWLNISDPTKLNGPLKVGLGSAGTGDQNEYIWSIEKDGLQAGWNELTLKFASAKETGMVDLEAINWFRIFRNSSESITMILDDVRAVEGTEGMILDCDSENGLKVLSESNVRSLASALSEHKEGLAGFKSVGTSATRWAVKMDTPVNLSEYQDGGIHFWLHISDPTKLNAALKVGLGSAGKGDEDEYIWVIEKDSLQAGWNEITLQFASVTPKGTVDFSAINWFRIFRNSNESVTMILDDVRGIK